MALVTVAQFRTDFPEFSSTVNYPDAQVQFYLNFAYKMLDPVRWDTVLAEGVELFTAHNLALERQNQSAAGGGGAPGVTVGALSSKAVGSVSAGYDVGAATVKDGGNWNQTNYGTRFLWLVSLIGAGPIQITGPDISWPPAVVPPIR